MFDPRQGQAAFDAKTAGMPLGVSANCGVRYLFNSVWHKHAGLLKNADKIDTLILGTVTLNSASFLF